MCAATIFCYSAIAQGVQCVFELPEGVALEIEACDVLEPWSKDTPETYVEACTHPQATSCAMESAASSIDTMLFELDLVRRPC
jgi:hypothetical protein